MSLSPPTLAEVLADIASSPISSRKGQPGAGERRGDEGKETRLCLAEECPPLRRGKGAVKEKVEDGMGLREAVEGWGSSVAMVHLGYEANPEAVGGEER